MEWYRVMVWGKPSRVDALPVPTHSKIEIDPIAEARIADGPGKRWKPAREGEPFAGPQLESGDDRPASVTAVHVPTPGHSDDHSIFFVPEIRSIFSADLFVTGKPMVARFDEDVLLHMASLERVLELDFDHLFCAHRGYVPNGRAAIQARLDHLRSLRNPPIDCSEGHWPRSPICLAYRLRLLCSSPRGGACAWI